MPSTWAQPVQLEALASLLGLPDKDKREFLTSPDDYLQRPAEGTDGVAFIELPHVSHALDIAWQTYLLFRPGLFVSPLGGTADSRCGSKDC